MIRRQPHVVLAALVGVLVAVYATPGRSPGGEEQAAEAAGQRAAPVQAPSSAAAARPVQRGQQHQRAAQLSWDRDPFTHGGSVGPTGGFTLTGILWDAQDPIAIINGEMLRVGDQLDGYRVTEIAQDHVSLSDGAQTYQLPIAP